MTAAAATAGCVERVLWGLHALSVVLLYEIFITTMYHIPHYPIMHATSPMLLYYQSFCLL